MHMTVQLVTLATSASILLKSTAAAPKSVEVETIADFLFADDGKPDACQKRSRACAGTRLNSMTCTAGAAAKDDDAPGNRIVTNQIYDKLNPFSESAGGANTNGIYDTDWRIQALNEAVCSSKDLCHEKTPCDKTAFVSAAAKMFPAKQPKDYVPWLSRLVMRSIMQRLGGVNLNDLDHEMLAPGLKKIAQDAADLAFPNDKCTEVNKKCKAVDKHQELVELVCIDGDDKSKWTLPRSQLTSKGLDEVLANLLCAQFENEKGVCGMKTLQAYRNQNRDGTPLKCTKDQILWEIESDMLGLLKEAEAEKVTNPGKALLGKYMDLRVGLATKDPAIQMTWSKGTLNRGTINAKDRLKKTA